jgi:hypothetical protein
VAPEIGDTMSERIRRFYLVAIWMPIIVPILCAASLAARGGGSFAGFGDGIGMILVSSLYSTGVPFAVFALWVTHWLRNPDRTEKEVRPLMWGAPLIVAAFAMPYWIVTMGFQDGVTTELVEGISLTYLPWLLVIGYLYVLATAAARWALRGSLKRGPEDVKDDLQEREARI